MGVSDLQLQQVASAELALDGEIEECQFANPLSSLPGDAALVAIRTAEAEGWQVWRGHARSSDPPPPPCLRHHGDGQARQIRRAEVRSRPTEPAAPPPVGCEPLRIAAAMSFGASILFTVSGQCHRRAEAHERRTAERPATRRKSRLPGPPGIEGSCARNGVSSRDRSGSPDGRLSDLRQSYLTSASPRSRSGCARPRPAMRRRSWH